MLHKNFIIFSIVCSVASLIFTVIAIISVNKGGQVMEDLDWGHAYDKQNGITQNLYFGVFGVESVVSNGNNHQDTRFLYKDCTNLSFCKTCKHYMPIVIGFLAAFIFMNLFSVGTDFMRMFSGNTAANQMIGIGSSLFAMLLGLVSLIVFAASCFKKARDYVDSTFPGSFTYTYGSAFGLVAVSVCLKFFDALFNGLVSVGDDAAAGGPMYGVVNTNNAPPPPAAAAAPAQPPAENAEVAMTQA